MTGFSKEFYDGRWDQGNIPIKLRGLRLDDYQYVHPSGKIALMESIDFADNFSDHFVSAKRAANGNIPDDRSNIGKGLMLYGRNGVRKTTLAVATITEVQYKSPSFFGYYIRFSDWKKALTDSFNKDTPELTANAHKILKLVEHSPLLVLDDIGQEHRTATGFTESMLHELLRVRYEAARPTIATTNKEPEELRTIYGASFDSFCHDAFVTLQMLGPDTRKPKRN